MYERALFTQDFKMLIAWARGKKGRDHKGYEDEIVSAVFGPLRYFHSQQQNQIFNEILTRSFQNSPDSKLALSSVEKCEFEFWPNIVPEGRIEPDITINMTHKDGSKTLLIIEAKWNSIQHDGQLKSQWSAAKNRYSEFNVLHIYLTRQPHSFDEMNVDDSNHRNNLVSLTWSRLAYIFRNLKIDDQVIDWANDVVNFLSGLGESPFVGFIEVLNKGGFRNMRWHPIWHFQPKLIRVSELASFAEWTSASTVKNWHFKIKKRNKCERY